MSKFYSAFFIPSAIGYAEKVFYNAKILQDTGQHPFDEAIAFKGKWIVAVGN